MILEDVICYLLYLQKQIDSCIQSSFRMGETGDFGKSKLWRLDFSTYEDIVRVYVITLHFLW